MRSDQAIMAPLAPDAPKDRFDVYRFFNGVSQEGKAGIDAGRTRIPLVKTFLLEHVSASCLQSKKPETLWADLTCETRPIDDSFFSITADWQDPQTKKTARKVVGFLEPFDARFFAFYTCEAVADAQKRVARWAQHPDLDMTWFSSPLLQTLWQKDVLFRGDARFTRLVFKHESIFEMPGDFAEPGPSQTSTDTARGMPSLPDEDGPEPEQRNARVELGDRIGRIRKSLHALQDSYDPMNALAALRIPSLTETGGHDLYQSGRVTNRTASFEDHRNTVRHIYGIYKSVLNYTEQLAWQDDRLLGGAAGDRGLPAGGAPLIVRFAEPLEKATFQRWINMAFQKRNRFKLWGQPIPMGPNKVHVYGADRHLWQPINLEITNEGLTALLPRGTCGNTFHRLVTNIQHYVSPKITTWLGATPFSDVVARWPANSTSAGAGTAHAAHAEGGHAR